MTAMNAYLREIHRLALAYLVAWHRAWVRRSSVYRIQVAGLSVALACRVGMLSCRPGGEMHGDLKAAAGLAFLFVAVSLMAKHRQEAATSKGG